MFSKNTKILIISSLDPSAGPGIVAEDFYKMFHNNNIEVDMLTKYKVSNRPEYLYVYDSKNSKSVFDLLPSKKLKSLLKKLFSKKSIIQRKGYGLFYRKETAPPAPVNDVLDKISKNYDAVIISFWQTLLSFETVSAIYDKLKCQIYFVCADYSPMTGGCHFPGECEKYTEGCGSCSALYFSMADTFTKFNMRYRKAIYDKIKPIVWVNTYMSTIFCKSILLKDYPRIEISYPLVDNNLFSPNNFSESREGLNISTDKFVIFFGCQYLHDKRKGVKYLLKALHILYSTMTKEERNDVLIMVAGGYFDLIKNQLEFENKYLGYVNLSELPKIYSTSNVFLCSSIIDAGPVMVNQAMSCGTPVVSFEVGTALDVVKNRNTGYCAKVKDVNGYSEGIMEIYKQFKYDNLEYMNLRSRCRKFAMDYTSESSLFNSFKECFNKYDLQK